MVDPVTTNRLIYRAMYLGLAAALLFLRLLPLSTMPVVFPGPDLLLCVTIAWVLRRDEYVPAIFIVLVFALEDMLVMRPPGLWALIVLLATEFLRRREEAMRDLPFLVEWAMVSVVMVAMMLAYRFVLLVTMVSQPGLGLTLLQVMTTIVGYPVVVILSQLALGLRKAAPGEVDALGHRV